MYKPISKKSDRLIILLFSTESESLVYHFLYKYPILLNFGHKLVIWDQCANFGLKIIIVYIFEKPSINNKSPNFLFYLTFFHSQYLPDI